MRIDSIGGDWRCTFPDGASAEVPVPGCFDAVAGRWDIGQPVTYETRFDWAGGGHARLRFGGVSYACEAFVNGVGVGAHEGMWDAFALDVDGAIRQGENALQLRITKPGYHADDPYPLRQVLSGFIPDVLATFGGIWDEVSLLTAPAFFVHDLFARGGMDGAGEASLDFEAAAPGVLGCSLQILDAQGNAVFASESELVVCAGKRRVSLGFALGDPALWSLDGPNLYRCKVALSMHGQRSEFERAFGFREIRAEGSRILLNGEPIYMRGILHWGYDERAMIPNPDEDAIRAEIEAMRAHGFNAIKHCLYIPRRRYFELMDELGMLAWVELPLWMPEPTPELFPRMRREYPHILDQLMGHPSVCVLSLGCELDGGVGGEILSEMYALARAAGALVRDNSGSGECYDGLAVDFADFFDYHFYAELPNLEPLIEAFTPGWRGHRPWVFGEFCDSDTLRDLAELRAARGVAALPWELDDPRKNPVSALKSDFCLGAHDAAMRKSGIRAEYPLLKALSYDHSLAHRKLTLELTRAFPELAGYNVTSIRDVPIATSGLIDDLGRQKFDPERFRQFNGDLALLPAWDLARVWLGADRVRNRERFNFFSGDGYALHVLLSNFGACDIEGGTLGYALTLDGVEPALCGDELAAPGLPRGCVREAGYVRLRLPEVSRPETLALRVWLDQGGERLCRNEWPVFVYPRPAPREQLFLYDPLNALACAEQCLGVQRLRENDPLPEDSGAVVIATLLSARLESFLRDGGRLVLVQPGPGALPTLDAPMWREGMVRPYDHPALDGIRKTAWYDDLRYFSLTPDAALDGDALEDMGYRVTPVLRRYDCRRWTASEYIAELALGRGRCMATTLKLGGGMGKQPMSVSDSPFAQYLLGCMIDHLRRN